MKIKVNPYFFVHLDSRYDERQRVIESLRVKLIEMETRDWPEGSCIDVHNVACASFYHYKTNDFWGIIETIDSYYQQFSFARKDDVGFYDIEDEIWLNLSDAEKKEIRIKKVTAFLTFLENPNKLQILDFVEIVNKV